MIKDSPMVENIRRIRKKIPRNLTMIAELQRVLL